MDNYTDTELRIKAKLEDLLSIRREYIKASADSQALKDEGNQLFEELRAELAVDLKPAKQTKKKKARKE
jgi:plasmid maintenance system killer protein